MMKTLTNYLYDDGIFVDNITDGCFGDLVCIKKDEDGNDIASVGRGVFVFTDVEKEHGLFFDTDGDITSVTMKLWDENCYQYPKKFDPKPFDQSVGDIIEKIKNEVAKLFINKEEDNENEPDMVNLRVQHITMKYCYEEYRCREIGLPSIKEFYNIFGKFCRETTCKLKKQYKDSIYKISCRTLNIICSNQTVWVELKVDIGSSKKNNAFKNVFDELCMNGGLKCAEKTAATVTEDCMTSNWRYLSLWKFCICSPEDLKNVEL